MKKIATKLVLLALTFATANAQDKVILSIKNFAFSYYSPGSLPKGLNATIYSKSGFNTSRTNSSFTGHFRITGRIGSSSDTKTYNFDRKIYYQEVGRVENKIKCPFDDNMLYMTTGATLEILTATYYTLGDKYTMTAIP